MLVRGWWERELELAEAAAKSAECFLLNLTKQKKNVLKTGVLFCFVNEPKHVSKSHKMDFPPFGDLLIYALKSMKSFTNVFLLKGLKTPKPK